MTKFMVARAEETEVSIRRGVQYSTEGSTVVLVRPAVNTTFQLADVVGVDGALCVRLLLDEHFYLFSNLPLGEPSGLSGRPKKLVRCWRAFSTSRVALDPGSWMPEDGPAAPDAH